MPSEIPTQITYGGRMEIRDSLDSQWLKITAPEQVWDVIEYCPYEPAAYVHEPVFLVTKAGAEDNWPLYCIAVGDVFPEPDYD